MFQNLVGVHKLWRDRVIALELPRYKREKSSTNKETEIEAAMRAAAARNRRSSTAASGS
jgi:hypothetical protein